MHAMNAIYMQCGAVWCGSVRFGSVRCGAVRWTYTMYVTYKVLRIT